MSVVLDLKTPFDSVDRADSLVLSLTEGCTRESNLCTLTTETDFALMAMFHPVHNEKWFSPELPSCNFVIEISMEIAPSSYDRRWSNG